MVSGEKNKKKTSPPSTVCVERPERGDLEGGEGEAMKDRKRL